MRLACALLLGHLLVGSAWATSHTPPCPALPYLAEDFPTSRHAPQNRSSLGRSLLHFLMPLTSTVKKAFSENQALIANRVAEAVNGGERSREIFEREFIRPSTSAGKLKVERSLRTIAPQTTLITAADGPYVAHLAKAKFHPIPSDFERRSPYFLIKDDRERESIRAHSFPDWSTDQVEDLALGIIEFRGWAKRRNRFDYVAEARWNRVVLSDGTELPATLILRGTSETVSLYHRARDIDRILGDVFQELDRLRNVGSEDERLRRSAAVTSRYYQAMPFDRGSAGAGNSYLAGQFAALFGRKLPFLDGVDRYAMTMDPEEFVTWYAGKLKKEKKGIPDGSPR